MYNHDELVYQEETKAERSAIFLERLFTNDAQTGQWLENEMVDTNRLALQAVDDHPELVSEQEIRSRVSLLHSKNSPGCDNIPARSTYPPSTQGAPERHLKISVCLQELEAGHNNIDPKRR